MADRDWAGAEARLGDFVKRWRQGDAVEEAALLLGRARLLSGRPADALDTLRALLDTSPRGRWTEKARWLMADAYARVRDWKSAAEALAARDEFLASPDHRQAVADLYLQVADEAFDGKEVADAFGRRTRVHDWPRALDFYRRARAVRLRPGDETRVAHRIATAALQCGDAPAAAAEWTLLLEKGKPGDLAAEATFGLGRALAAAGDRPAARRRFREVADRWTDGPFAPRALVALGDTHDPLGTSSREELERGLAAWREFRKLFSGHADGPATAYRIGLALARFGDRVKAITEWKEFLERWPTHDQAPEAMHGIALAKLGLEDFDGARAAWKDLLGRWPNHPLWAEAQRMLPQVPIARAETEMREKRWDAAAQAWRKFLEEFPAHEAAALAQMRLGDALKEKGEKDAALEAWRLVPRKYPEDAQAPAAWARVASFLADVTGDLPAAIAEDEGLASRYPGSAQGQEARRTLEEMKGKRLEASLVRPCTTERKPRVAFRLRNVDRLRMKAYRVDLPEYVRAKGSLRGAEDVLTEVVKPDAEWVWQPERYERFRLLDRECEIPVQGPGSWIVRAQDEELTATLLVVSSDLAAVVKRAPGQTPVFVVNERTGEPVPGARVVLPVGKGAVTGEDGVWTGGDSDGKVLAEKDGHLAFALAESGPGTSFGYSPKVYLFPDRPLYRPGQEVALKGFARRVHAGAYQCRAGDKVVLEVEDPRGAVLLRREARTGEFGGVEERLVLPEGAPLGTYRVTARYEDLTFQAGFEVREFRKPEVEVELRGASPTWLTGEEVKATVTLRYGSGGPVRGAPVRWRVGRLPFEFDPSALASYAAWFRDPAREEERRKRAASQGDFVEVAAGETATDAKGQAALSFPTEAADRDFQYVLEVMARDSNGEWVRDAASFPVTRQGFYAVARAERKVYRPKEDMTLELFTVDALQNPVKREGVAVLARRRDMGGGRVAEEEVSTAPVATGEDGRATVKLRTDRPGEYALRFRGKDVRGNAVEASAPVTVSGDAEDLAKDLKLVCDRETYREGDEAVVLLNAPAAPKAVLLTFEGERVLRHRVVRATERSTTLKVPMEPLFAPNVFVRAAALHEGRLLESGDEVLVFRYLQVAVEPEKAEARPGEKVAVRVRTTDQRGNPVRAEVAVAAVDRAVYALQPDRTPDPKPFFYDQRRTLGVATTSTYAHLPGGVTRPTSKDLLAEEARRLGKAGFERMMRHVREGRAALERGEFAQAQAELERALELAPGQYDARVLLVQARERARAQLDAETMGAEKGELAERLASDELRRVVDRAKGPGAPKPAAAPATAAGRPSGKARATREGERKSLKDKSLGDPRDANEPMESDEEAGFDQDGGGGDPAVAGGAAYGGRRGNGPGGWRHVRFKVADLGLLAQQQAPGGAWGAEPVVPAALRERFEDRALWQGGVVTGADGEARVTIDLPDNLTSWRITARGASVDTLVGEGRGALAVRQPLLVRVDAPRFLGARDETTATATVHNNTGGKVDAKVALVAEGVDARDATATQAAFEDGDVKSFPFRIAGTVHGMATLRAEALSSVASDAQKVGLPVLPHGLRWFRGASGDCADGAVAVLDLPEKPVAGTVRLVLSISPALDGVLLEAVSWNGGFPYGCLEQTVNRFLPALAAEQALRTAGVPNLALRDRLREAVERGLLALYAVQRDDGSFGWFGGGRGEPDPAMTAYAVLGMLRAERQGFLLSPRNRALAIDAGRRLVKGAPPDERAFLLFALAHGGAADLEDLNSVFRSRETLTDRGLALLALAMDLTGRRDRALEAVEALRARAVTEGDLLHWDDAVESCKRRGLWTDEMRPWFARDAEPTALALQAFLAVHPDDPVVDPAVRWLLASRRGPCWRSTRDTAAVVDALAAVLVRRGVRRNDFRLSVFVNDGAQPAETLEVRTPTDGSATTREVVLDAKALKPGRNTVRLAKEGPGAFHWAAALEAYVEGEDIPAAGNLVRVERRYVRYVPRRAPTMPADDEPPVGWSCLEPSARPGDEALPSIARAGSGDLFRVTLSVEAKQPLRYVLVEDPLPAGCEVLEGREEGAFDRFERRNDRAVFFLSSLPQGKATLTYVLQAVHPGSYRALPARAAGMYEPEVNGRSAEARLAVVPEAGVVGRRAEGEKVTPDEVLFLARRALKRERWEEARDAFRTLLKEWKPLDEVQAEAWEGIRRASFALRDSKGAVEAHEALLERDPRRVPQGLEDLLALGRAYAAMGEHERAASILRSLADRFFAEERAVAQAYEQIGAGPRALEYRGELLLRFPDGAATDAEDLALAQALREARRPANPVAKPAAGAPAAGGAVGFLLPEAAERLRRLLAHRPDLPNADEADMLLVDTLRRMELLQESLEEGARFLARYPASRWLDDVDWFLAGAAFDKGEYDRAVALSEPLLSQVFPRDDDPSRKETSPLRPRAWHLRGKVAHLRGDLAEAVRWYEQARHWVEDAADAYVFLTAARLEVPELATFVPGEEPELPVRRRNVGALEARVYPVDFMILYAVRKDLSAVNRIDLTGIVPAGRVERAWQDAGDHRWHEEKVRLPVKDKGVYLVNLRGGAEGACIVVLSDLRLEVQQAGPRLRVYATDAKTGAPVPEAYVKVADAGAIRAQGFTDARGVFEAGQVGGSFSVVAEKDGSYALYRK